MFEGALGSAGCMGKFTQQTTDIRVSFTDASCFSLASGFMVARANPNPRSQAVRGFKYLHIIADFDSQHSGTHLINTRDSLEQLQDAAILV